MKRSVCRISPGGVAQPVSDVFTHRPAKHSRPRPSIAVRYNFLHRQPLFVLLPTDPGWCAAIAVLTESRDVSLMPPSWRVSVLPNVNFPSSY